MHESVDAAVLDMLQFEPSKIYTIALRQFATDSEAHDDEFQRRCWKEMLFTLNHALDLASKTLGPAARHRNNASIAVELPSTYSELALWHLPDGRPAYILMEKEDRECPIVILGGAVD